VAERLGLNPDEALSLGKALAGLNAQSKGRRLGIFKLAPKEIRKFRERERDEEFWVELLGRRLPAVNTDQGVRAVVESKPIAPETVERYLESKFGDALPEARNAMMKLAQAFARMNWRSVDSASTSNSDPRFLKVLLDGARRGN
jgi:hypothetical protein